MTNSQIFGECLIVNLYRILIQTLRQSFLQVCRGREKGWSTKSSERDQTISSSIRERVVGDEKGYSHTALLKEILLKV